jgi:serine/threonine protein kinase
LPLVEACDVLIPVVSAVGTAHASGVVHRDLKPENVFLVDLGQGRRDARVLDFGIAKLTPASDEAPQASITTAGAVLGTLHYMAPEQVFCERDLDHRVDVWALGVILYECVTGRRPTEGENAGQVLKVITSTRIPRVERWAPDLPGEVADLIMRMLARRREKRPSDLREVLDVLQRHSPTRSLDFAAPSIEPPPRAEPEPLPMDPVHQAATATFDGDLFSTERLTSAGIEKPPGQTGSPAFLVRLSVALAALTLTAAAILAVALR